VSADWDRAYVYEDPKGKPKFRKLRRIKPGLDGRKFLMDSWSDTSHCWVGVTDRQEDFKSRALYRLPEVLRALKRGDPVYWCEGEKDADAIRMLLNGKGAATSHMLGAMTATPEQASWFRSARKVSAGGEPQQVFLVADVDGAGAADVLHRQSLLIKMMNAAYYGKKPVPNLKLTVLVPPQQYSDAAEAIMAGARLEDFREPDGFKLWRTAERYLAERKVNGIGARDASDWMGVSYSKWKGFTKDWKPKQISSKAKRKKAA
jgi:hypothetical protein